MATISNVSQFNPTSISGCALWLDAADSSRFSLTNNNITQWRDKSVNQFVGSASNNPTYVFDPVSKLNTVSLNGTNQYFNFGNVLNMLDSNISIFTVANFNSTADGSIVAKSLFGSGPGRYGIIRLANPSDFGGLGTLITTATISVTAKVTDTTTGNRLISSTWDRNILNFYINASIVASTPAIDTSSTLNTYNLYVGAYNNNTGTGVQTGLFFSGTLSEILIYLSPLTTLQRQQIEGYLAWKWNLQANLPISHSYYYNPGIPNLVLQTQLANPIVIVNTEEFQPTFIPGCALWLDAADSSTLFQNTAGTTLITASGQSIGFWKDKSASNYSLVSIISPTYNGSDRSISFTGTQYMSNALSASVTVETAFIISKINNLNNTNTTLSANNDGARQFRYNSATNGTNTFSSVKQNIINVLDTPSSIPNNVLFLGSYVNTGTTLTHYANGTSLGSSNTISYTAGRNTVLGRQFQNAEYMNGFIYEIIVYQNTILTTSQRQQVEGYLAWKWGLQSLLPTTHPYYYNQIMPNLVLQTQLLNPYIITNIYTGNLTSFNPTQISGLALWLDAADSSTLFQDTDGRIPVTTTGQSIARWNDKSGNTRNAIGNIGTGTYSSNGLNSRLPAINITPTGNMRSPVPAGTFSSSVSGFFIFQKYGANGVNGDTVISRSLTSLPASFDIYTQSNGITIRLIGNGTNPNYTFYNGSDSTFRNRTATIYYFNINSSALTTWNESVNGVSAIYSTGGNPAYGDIGTSIHIGTCDDSSTTMTGYISEIIFYNTTLTTQQRQQIEGYLAWKWGLQSQLPSSHPFSTFPPGLG